MGLNRIRVDQGPVVGEISEGAVPRGRTLDPADVIEKLAERCPGVNADWGARHNIWHPDIETKQGVFYYHRHICSMDREPLRQWPEWEVSEELVEVPIAHALLHDDLPIVLLNEHGEDDITNQDTAFVFRMKPERVKHIGWAELFYRLLAYGLPSIDRTWLERTFAVSLEWMNSMNESPLIASYNQVERRTPGERVVSLTLPGNERFD